MRDKLFKLMFPEHYKELMLLKEENDRLWNTIPLLDIEVFRKKRELLRRMELAALNRYHKGSG